jgi:response regulator RpfG family c-di-GMP phosphodiesterase
MAFADYLPALLAGEEIEPVESNETYGWLLTLYRPIRNSEGVTQCYAAVDLNMNHITVDGYRFLAKVLALFLGFFVIVMTVALWLAEYNVIQPINSMAQTASRFAFDSEEARVEALGSIRYLDIHTDDEIENLYDAMVKTTEDMLSNIAHMQGQNEKISKLQNGLIMVLADMVESRDENTGDHVRKTAAYVNLIAQELRKAHIYEDQLTDEFIRDVVNSAPLHDVGKIHIPDAILNKPGKLTDEEFEKMKTHTTAGSDIITKAMSMVSDTSSSYLEEARNLAHYHHEKWNGKGYPEGLKGEEIPLSARIMAVADVFDALVSRRSYKDPFPFEKAMDIIREGSGSHFDPNIAEVFIKASDEVRGIMNTYMG